MRITPKQYAQAWQSQLHSAPRNTWDAIAQSMMELIRRNGHMKWINEILRLVEKEEMAAAKKIPVTATMAHPMTTTQIEKHIAQLMPNCTPAITAVTNPSLIGGLCIETEDTRWNCSLQAQLASMAKTINE